MLRTAGRNKPVHGRFRLAEIPDKAGLASPQTPTGVGLIPAFWCHA